VEVTKKLFVAVRRKRGELRTDRSLSVRHEKAPAHPSLRVSQSLAGKAFPPWIIRRTLLAWLQLTSGCFHNSKSARKGKRFSEVEDIESFVKKMHSLLY
jgi:hypothetical protein